MRLDVAGSTRGLERDERGIWRSAAARELSFPERGHGVCQQVEEQSFWFAHRNACLAELLRRFPPSGTLLDVGGGNGFVCRGLRDAGFDAALLEPGPEGAAHGKQAGIEQVLCSTLADAHFADGSVPAAGVFDVLEHVEDDAALLRELHRVLVPGGLLLVTVPAGPWLWSDDDEYAGHFRRYRIGDLRDRLRTAGFEPLYAGHLFAPLVLPLFLLKALPSRLGARSRNADARAVQQDHSPGGILQAAVDGALRLERARLARGGVLPLGTSCVAVARR